jgi:hypothetical protein
MSGGGAYSLTGAKSLGVLYGIFCLAADGWVRACPAHAWCGAVGR